MEKEYGDHPAVKEWLKNKKLEENKSENISNDVTIFEISSDIDKNLDSLDEEDRKRETIKQAEERIMARRSALLAGGFGNMIIREEARLDVLYKEMEEAQDTTPRGIRFECLRSTLQFPLG